MHWSIWNMCKELELKPVQTNTHTHNHFKLAWKRILTTFPSDLIGWSQNTFSSIPCEAATVPCNTCSPPLPVGKEPSPGSNDGRRTKNSACLYRICEITIGCFIDLYEKPRFIQHMNGMKKLLCLFATQINLDSSCVAKSTHRKSTEHCHFIDQTRSGWAVRPPASYSPICCFLWDGFQKVFHDLHIDDKKGQFESPSICSIYVYICIY